MRKLFIHKHTWYVCVLIILWLAQLLINYYELFRPNGDDMTNLDDNKVTANISMISFTFMFLTGMAMAFIRLFDPYFAFLVKRKFFQTFGSVIEEDQQGIKSEILSTFLASSLNIELVYIILAGITRFSNSQSLYKNTLQDFLDGRQDEPLHHSDTSSKRSRSTHDVRSS